MSLNGTAQTFIPYTLNGINTLATPNDISSCVKYSGNTSDTNLDGYDLGTTGTLSAQFLALPPDNTKTEDFVMYSISTNGNLSSSGGLITQNLTTGQSMYFTGGVVGAPNFQFTTLGTGGKVVVTDGNRVMSTTISAGQLQYITALHSNAGGIGEINTWSGIQIHSANVSTTGSAQFIQPYNAGVLDISTLVNRATLDSAISAIPNLLTSNNTWTGVNQFNATVSTMGSNKFIQPYNATGADISTLVNRATLDAGLALIPNLLPLSNTWTGALNNFTNPITAYRVGSFQGYLTSDVRRIAPIDLSATTHKPFFGTYANDNGAGPFADIVGMNGWANGSGGNSNLLMLSKSGIGMRLYQGLYGSLTPFTTYNDVQLVENNGDVIMGGSLSLGNRLLGSTDASPTGNFWMGLRGSGTEADRLAIAIAGNATTGAVSLIGLNKPTTCVGLTVPTGNLDVGTGTFNKLGTTAGYYATITGGDTTNSPYMEFYANSLRRLYIGYASASYVNIWAENGVNMNFGTNATQRMVIDTAGNVDVSSRELRVSQLNGNGQVRLKSGNRQQSALFHCNDDWLYFLATDNGDWTSTYNTTRPIKYNLTSGQVIMGNGLEVYGTTAITGALTASETSLIGFTTPPLTYPFTGNKDLYVNGSIYSAGTNAMVATFGRNTTGTPYNEITFTAGGAGVLLAQIKSHTTGASIVDATWTYSNTNANPLGANQGQVLLTADSLTASVANGFAVAGSYIIKLGTTAGYDVRIEGGTATNSGYINFYSAGVSRGYLGNATGADLDLVAQGGAQLNFYTAGVKNLKIDNTGNLTMTHQKSLFLYDFGASNNAGIKSEATGDLSIFTGTAGVATRMTIGRDGNILLTGNLQMTITQPIYLYYISGTNTAGIKCEGSGDMAFFTGTSGVSTRLTIQGGGNMLHTSGNNSYIKYGPNATWGAYLAVGATPDRAGAGTAQLITTNGNVHVDAANNADIYYGYYANSRGTPNAHRFYGSDFNFSTVPQNYSPYSQVCVFAGDQMRRSQCMMQESYRNESVSWAGGINITYSFYKFNAQCSVKISGKYAMYSTYVGNQQMGLRIYSQSTGAYFYYGFTTYQSQTYIQTTYPFEIILTEADLGTFTLGWFDVYIYNSSGISTDANDQLHVNVQVLPVDSF